MKILLIYLKQDKGLSSTLRRKEGLRYSNLGTARPLALEILASLTPTNVELRLVDDNYESIDFNGHYDLVGLHAHDSLAAYRGKFIYNKFKQRKIPVIIGGRFIQTIPIEAALECADACVMSEVEDIWVEVLEDVKKGKLKRIYQSNILVDLSDKNLPLPRRDLIKNNYYKYHTIEVARGCINNCNFCTANVLFKARYRPYPIERIESDLKNVLLKFDFKKNLIYFVDEDIGLEPNFKIELFNRLEKYNIPWIALAGVGVSRNNKLLKIMAKSGCKMLYIGFETLDNDNLISLNKAGINKVEEYKDIVDNVHSYNIGVCGLFIFGLDNDRKGVARRTLKFVKETKMNRAAASVLTPVYNSIIYHLFMKENRITSKEWFKYWYKVVYRPKNMSSEELREEFNYFTKISKRRARMKKFVGSMLCLFKRVIARLFKILMNIYKRMIKLNTLTNVKRYFLILIFFLVIQSGYEIKFVSADDEKISSLNLTQQEESRDEIKKVVEAYLQSFANRDIKSMMNQVSKNYSVKTKDDVIDYSKFFTAMENSLDNAVDIKLSEIKITVVDVLSDKAVVSVEHKFKAFSLGKLDPIDKVVKLNLILAREDQSWKIVSRNKSLGD